MNSNERYHSLDFVRAIAMLLGVLLHVSMHFAEHSKIPWAFNTWSTGESHGNVLNTNISNFIHLFRMQLFYLIAGFFAQLVIDRKGYEYFSKDRLKRILVPFIFGVVILMPLTMGVWHNYAPYSNELINVGLFGRIKIAFLWGYFNTGKEFGVDVIAFQHFWFLYFLFIFYFIHIFFIRNLKKFTPRFFKNICSGFIRSSFKDYKGMFLVVLLIFPLQYTLEDPFYPVNQFNFGVNNLSVYFIFYLLGVGLFQCKELLQRISKNCWIYLLISIPLILFLTEPTDKSKYDAVVITDLLSWKIFSLNLINEAIFIGGYERSLIVFFRVLASISISLSIIGLAFRYINKENKVVRYFSDSAYWVYWLHLSITFNLSYFFHDVPWLNSLSKTYVVLLVSILILYLTYDIIIKSNFISAYFIGKSSSKGYACFNITKFFRSNIFSILIIGVGIHLFGEMHEYRSIAEGNHVLMEASIARDKKLITSIKTIDGIKDDYGRTPLHTATLFPETIRNYNTFELLVKKSTNLDEVDMSGRTPLFYAVRTGNIDDVKLLINSGADLNMADIYGHTPAHVAAIKTGLKQMDISRIYYKILLSLRDGGADLELRDYMGRNVNDCQKIFGKAEYSLSN